jgi:hypothetical protein
VLFAFFVKFPALGLELVLEEAGWFFHFPSTQPLLFLNKPARQTAIPLISSRLL